MGRTRDRPATRGATIADVAQRAGVGVSTVSRVLADSQVSAPARERVLSAMIDLGYRPRDMLPDGRRRLPAARERPGAGVALDADARDGDPFAPLPVRRRAH